MLTSLMFYEMKHSNVGRKIQWRENYYLLMFYLADEEKFQKFELKLREFIIAIQSGLVQMVLTFGVHLFFE
jgi:hypothetical protein